MKKILFLTFFLKFCLNAYAIEKLPFQHSDYKYELNIPSSIKIEIIGKDFIKYLKQIKITSQKDSLNSRVIDSSKKKWVKSKLMIDDDINIKSKIKIHGDWNDHISFPYSSLRLKTNKKYFFQLKEIIFFKPETRNGNAEVFSTIFLQEMGFLAPFTREIFLKINNHSKVKYLLQEKINKNFIERSGFREGPILEYDERHRWNTIKLGHDLNGVKFAKIYKLDNENFISNPKKEMINDQKLNLVSLALEKTTNIKEYLNKENELFEISLSLLGACHGLIDHNRKFYFDGVYKKFIPIYYDGMAFEQNLNFCQNYRITSNKKFFSTSNLNFFDKKMNDNEFKNNLKKKYSKLTLRNDDFEKYWSKLSMNYLKFKKEVIEKTSQENELKENDKFDNLEFLKPNYTLIYYFKDNQKYYECFKNKNKIDLISNEGEIIQIDLNNYCKIMNKRKFNDMLRNKIFYKSEKDKNLKIFPTFLPKLNKPFIKREYIEISKEETEIEIEKNTIKFLYSKRLNSIKKINIKSKFPGDGAIVLFGDFPKIQNITYTEDNPKRIKNVFLNSVNLTGCLNIYNAKANIENIFINNSSCEDGLNIVSSKLIIDNIVVKNTISDGVDFDFSELKINNIISQNSEGDCVDVSFGDYRFGKVSSLNCVDKGISIGENSNVFVESAEIKNNNIGIAVKDSSILTIKNLSQDINNNRCLSLYNKKPEFADGIVYYTNIDDNCLNNSVFTKNSIIEKIN